MRMSTMLNNTRVRNSLDCPNNDTFAFIGCQGSSGSVYDTTRGSFIQVVNIQDWNVTTVDQQPDDGGTTVLHGYDAANFTDGPAVAFGYPFEVWADYDALNKSAVAFGPNSSTLESFLRNEVAPARSFSLDYGSTSELYPRDGQLIIGGYNEARFNASQVSTFRMWGANAPAACPLQVTIADIILTNKDGDHPLTDPGTRVAACIDTVHNSFAFTPAIFNKFENIGNNTGNHAGSDGEAFDESNFPLDSEPLIGTLTIRLTNGYTTVIPHYELVSNVRGTDPQGKYSVLNNTRLSTTVSSGIGDLGENVPVLGGVFLSQNYLHVDYDAGSFWLSPQVGNGTLPDRITAACNGTLTGDGKASEFVIQVGVPVAVGAGVFFFIGLWIWSRHRKRNPQSRDASRSIPRNEKRDAPGSSASTTMFAGYGYANNNSTRSHLTRLAVHDYTSHANGSPPTRPPGHGLASHVNSPLPFAGYDNAHHANPGEHMELEGDPGIPVAQRAELAEPVTPYSRAEWPRQNSIQGENDSYYKQFEEPGETYELADTSSCSKLVPLASPLPAQREEAGLSEHWVPNSGTSQGHATTFSDAVSPTSEGTNSTNVHSYISPI
ncbi:uncharacterized protein LY79DRAFT_596878 [Colletotrichum navitas]|uniref:Peptidase A1 domain-containing protein n=1 Tax=Colletotrichum navitas TaxID=681940 RepID=A0AAD8V9J4_9PEZI|nr:uncharacterized protein LY79DRAFT_596878 [Colletotrichum navitas]KAK1599372.1 hypothetical protein LY79DRAFT_596878 [Colletotrichum navitas]